MGIIVIVCRVHLLYSLTHCWFQVIAPKNCILQLCFIWFSAAYLGLCHGDNSLNQEIQTFLSLATSTISSGGNSNKFPSQPRDIISPVCPCLPWHLFPDGHAQSNTHGKHPGAILTRCPNHPNWLLSTGRSNHSSLSLSGMSEVLTLFLRLSPVTPRWKLISAACIRNLNRNILYISKKLSPLDLSINAVSGGLVSPSSLGPLPEAWEPEGPTQDLSCS